MQGVGYIFSAKYISPNVDQVVNIISATLVTWYNKLRIYAFVQQYHGLISVNIKGSLTYV